MKQIINFIDRDVDGDGINIKTLIQVEGEPLTAGVVQITGIDLGIVFGRGL